MKYRNVLQDSTEYRRTPRRAQSTTRHSPPQPYTNSNTYANSSAEQLRAQIDALREEVQIFSFFSKFQHTP